MSAMEKKLLVIDVDAGVDDAVALMMALGAPNVEVLGITCCFGNTSVDNVCKNVLRVLQKCNSLQIPVYKGASSPFLNNLKSDNYFGKDGLGDIPDPDAPGLDKLQQEHAVPAMIRMINQLPGQVTLVATAPLTNLALAVKMDPSLPMKIKNLFMMGGNMNSRGNIDACSEFNFAADPEAAYTVLNEYICPTYIATWEFVCMYTLPWEFYEQWTSQNSKKAKFLREINAYTAANLKKHVQKSTILFWTPGYIPSDCFAIAAAIDKNFITKTIVCAVSVELAGFHTRGMMVLDVDNKLQKKNQVSIMMECNVEKFKTLLINSLK
ncbi:inosine-uridine preferring nucleoside hydrolase-like isoform X1 [Antechinus flavipes]|uniref:inosine-uridine preferring nucleoside hydrolase-like isoform X1 n=1 Tax=Antechinus flavipes TaxID=38775 RepID=UPI002235DE69|nr:inosine-uridine preferring nucleoside hydrolase-like isoform X1 [Antechinus flavipes]XP_051840645.1 inosine-uridine preferring nucleoside hydrolase-like isoform X1 [Antechinus flavipes]